jgi:PKD repeat protein
VFSFTDKDGARGSATARIVVHRPPVAAAGGSYSGVEGSPITFRGSGSDPDGDAIIAYAWDFGDGTSGSGQTVTHVYADNAPSVRGYTVSLTVTDANNARSAASTTGADVSNVAPLASFNVPASTNEGSNFTISLTNPIDAAGDLPTLAYAFDCGNGSGFSVFSGVNSRLCPTTDDGLPNVRGRVRDKDGGLNEYVIGARVVNVAPSVAIVSAPSTVAAKANFNLQFRFSDPGVIDNPWYYQIVWGDGGKNTGPTAVTSQGPTITQPYSYKKAGTYTITIRVADKNGGIGTATLQVIAR